MIRTATAALAVAAALAVPSAASAAPMAENFNLSLTSQTADLGANHIWGHDPIGLAHYDLHVKTRATWTGNLSTIVGWNSTNVRQGADLTVSRQAFYPSGSMKVTWTVTGFVSRTDAPPMDFGTKTGTKDVACMPALLAGSYECAATSNGIRLVHMVGVPASLYVKLALQVRFTITGEGAVVTRGVSVVGAPPSPTADLPLSPALTTETLRLPCGPVGSDASYRLGSPRWTPAVAVKQQARLEIGLMDPVLGVAEQPALYQGPYDDPWYINGVFKLAGSGHTTDLGSLQANNVAPTIASLGTFTGKAGSPVYFSADTTERCPISSYVWKFSNGTTSYGPAPQRTFSTPGVYDGELTVTDESGLKAKRSFSVEVK